MDIDDHYIIFDIVTNYLQDLQNCINFSMVCKDFKNIAKYLYDRYHSAFRLTSVLNKIGFNLYLTDKDYKDDYNLFFRCLTADCCTEIWKDNCYMGSIFNDPLNPVKSHTGRLKKLKQIRESPILSNALSFAHKPRYYLRNKEMDFL